MKNILFLVPVLLSWALTYGQHPVSGLVKFDNAAEWEPRVYLKQVHPGSPENTPLAAAEISEDGFFAFDADKFTSENELYKIEVRKIRSINDSEATSTRNSVSFIMSRNDSLYFHATAAPFSDYSTSSVANKEWQRLQALQEDSQTEIAAGPDDYLKKTRDYTRDSLQILMVKLLSIRTLEEQQLLQRDIKENPEYYLDFLQKLQESELPPASYASLEQRITTTYQKLLQRKYYTSLAINGLLCIAIAALIFTGVRWRRKNFSHPEVALSQQEEKVKALILEGKTNKEIAGELFISISTVKTHITNIYNKLAVSNRKELILKS